jgi:hypothetical protein
MKSGGKEAGIASTLKEMNGLSSEIFAVLN